MLITYILIILGFILLIKGADFLVEGAKLIAKKFHVPEIVIGLTIVSIGTSFPELFVSLASIINGSSDMAIGNIIGSNLCNLLLILGLSALIRPVKFQRETRLIEIPMCLIITLVFLIFCNTELKIVRFEAIILLFMFVMFILYTIFMAIKGEEFDREEMLIETKIEKSEEKISILKNILYIVIGIILLKIGGNFTVNNSVELARKFNLSEKIIGLTILSIGTSLPELVTSVTASIKNDSDIAIGNIIGSNVFNILLIIGTSSVIRPLSYNVSYNMQMSILIIAMILLALFAIIPPKNKMSRIEGLIYLIMYILYIKFTFI